MGISKHARFGYHRFVGIGFAPLQLLVQSSSTEIVGHLPEVNPHDGIALIRETFGCPIYVVIYLIWFVALWFHLTHGFWSAMQTIGINNHVWFNRWKCISNIFATIICLGFAAVAISFYVMSLTGCGTCTL